jgi:hypothetical protein
MYGAVHNIASGKAEKPVYSCLCGPKVENFPGLAQTAAAPI